MTLKPAITHISVTDQVADFIVMEVASGNLKPGEKVAEREICESLQVSRVPVREAMRLLQAQGLLHAKPNRGVFVNAPSMSETMEMLEVRETVEGIAIRRVLSDPDRSAQTRAALDRCVRELEKCALLDDLPAYCRADLSFHRTLIELSGSSVLMSLWQSISRNVFVFLLHERSDVFDFEESIEDHRRLVQAIFEDPTGLAAELKHHLIGPILKNHPEIKSDEHT
ncbi:GntR family transcriptional regulator [Epibacterium sp. Ofav1-8]|uniref:GntR family transcriptional regulator n=1 Tax=Epibacterium sp. Ofav1-8 TaxID=2917735 RepID=UPI001EF4DC76|nr:GntR family transcriptional regulator [Epibacterium sp. Ofav1-8]MCG7625091.1 GntR family transcriptional regulator [Epibacterium sp. Ofav1-8]